MTKQLITAVLCALLPLGALGAGDPAAGRTKAEACAFCHQLDGHSEQPAFPKLAGQFEAYLLQQALLFHSGARKDDSMESVTLMINNPQDLADIAAHYAAQPPMHGTGASSENTKEGKRHYETYNCHLCHGTDGLGQPAKDGPNPRLAGQHRQYLIKAMREFRANTRRSKNGYMMNMILPLLGDREIERIADYLSELPARKSAE
ncbi:MAG: c-type cytochrome [Pseudomonadota bacterium]